MQTLSNSETMKTEEMDDGRTGNERTDDNHQLRQLLVNAPIKRPPAADSGIDTQSNTSEPPPCQPLPPQSAPVPNLLPHQPIPISSSNLWSYNTQKPTVGYSPEHTVSVRAPGLEVMSPHQVSYPVFASPQQQPQPSTYIVTDQAFGIPGTCPQNADNAVCFASPVQNDSSIHFYDGYRHSLPPSHVYEAPRHDTPYIPSVAFNQPQTVYEVNNHLISASPNIQHISYDGNISYANHITSQPSQGLYSSEQSQFIPRMEPNLITNVQAAHPRLPSLSLGGQTETECCLPSPQYAQNGQPIPIPDATDSWNGCPEDQQDHHGQSGGRGANLTGNPNGQIQLWSFILDELENTDSQDVLCWTGDGWEFRFKDPEKVAKKWGEQKNKPSMNYEKMSRGLRYYYDKDIIRKSSTGGRYHYRFTDKKMRERTHFTPNEYFRHLGITPQKEDPGK